MKAFNATCPICGEVLRFDGTEHPLDVIWAGAEHKAKHTGEDVEVIMDRAVLGGMPPEVLPRA